MKRPGAPPCSKIQFIMGIGAPRTEDNSLARFHVNSNILLPRFSWFAIPGGSQVVRSAPRAFCPSSARTKPTRSIGWLYLTFTGADNILKATKCGLYSQKSKMIASLPNPRACPISPAVSLSIVALEQAIKSAATTIYSIPQADLQMPWGTSPLLRNYLCDVGWCPKDISMLSDPRDASIEVQYRLTTEPYSRASTDHRRCTEFECSGERVDTDHYVTQHTSSDCQCTTLDVEEDFLGVLRQGGMPLVSFRTCGLQGSPTVDVVDYKSQSLV